MSNELLQKITLVLVYSQFVHWVDPQPKTTEQANTQRQRAEDFYLGENLTTKEEVMKSNRFSSVIKEQVGYIARLIQTVSTAE